MHLNYRDFTLMTTEPDDPELKSLLQDEVALKNLSETRQYSAAMPDRFVFRIERDGKLIGEVSLQTIRWFNRKAEISIIFLPEYRGKGLGAKVLKEVIDYAFNRMNLHRLEAEIYEYNTAAQKLFERFGFQKEGRLREARYTDGKYYDIVRYGLLRSEWNQND
ncbi:MAG TPA: N-acetyltransferase [Calditrichaeota bacterium]|nr:N-acetyltransferase [Calditrichota bacterium]